VLRSHFDVEVRPGRAEGCDDIAVDEHRCRDRAHAVLELLVIDRVAARTCGIGIPGELRRVDDCSLGVTLELLAEHAVAPSLPPGQQRFAGGRAMGWDELLRMCPCAPDRIGVDDAQRGPIARDGEVRAATRVLVKARDRGQRERRER
jgi:hypothetical protein